MITIEYVPRSRGMIKLTNDKTFKKSRSCLMTSSKETKWFSICLRKSAMAKMNK